MDVTSLFRSDHTNVGDWYCAPRRFFQLPGPEEDILKAPIESLRGHVLVGGGGLVATTFHTQMSRLAKQRPYLDSLVAWGLGESLNVDRQGGVVPPHTGPLPGYLEAFDLVGIRDWGTEYRWTPCASCMLPHFDRAAPATTEVIVYSHKRIPIPISGFPHLTNDGCDIDAVISFLGSGEVVITNSYHGAYWATLLGRRVLSVPNMSKMYRMKHPPTLCSPASWTSLVDATVSYPKALDECRAANIAFYNDLMVFYGGSGRS